jgi:hypothetical protein
MCGSSCAECWSSKRAQKPSCSQPGGRKPEPERCLLSRRDAFEVARILEGHGRALWNVGVRDSRPKQVKLEADSASWPVGSLRISRLYEMIELQRAPDAAFFELKLVELVEVIQVLDSLAGGHPVSAGFSCEIRL